MLHADQLERLRTVGDTTSIIGREELNESEASGLRLEHGQKESPGQTDILLPYTEVIVGHVNNISSRRRRSISGLRGTKSVYRLTLKIHRKASRIGEVGWLVGGCMGGWVEYRPTTHTQAHCNHDCRRHCIAEEGNFTAESPSSIALLYYISLSR